MSASNRDRLWGSAVRCWPAFGRPRLLLEGGLRGRRRPRARPTRRKPSAAGLIGSRRGVTLIEMIIVVALLGLLVGITFPAVTAGVDSLRLSSATDSIVSFLNGAMNRAERRQQVVEVTIAPAEDTLSLRSSEAGFERTLELPEGVEIRAILPPAPMERTATRRFMLYPGGTVPGFGIELVNRRGTRRIVSVDPVVGAPAVEVPGR